MLPSVDGLAAAAAAFAASGLAVGDPEIAALASAAENPWMWHHTSVFWQRNNIWLQQLKKRITAHLIQCSLQSKGITDTERRTHRGLEWDKVYVVTDRIFQALAYLHLYEKL